MLGCLSFHPRKIVTTGEGGAVTTGDAVLVLVDADEEHCIVLKDSLVTLATSLNPRPNVVFRIAVEETEAFYLGDLRALQIAFPDADMAKARRYTPDSVCGTAEKFGEIVDDGGLNKVHWAEEMGPRITVDPGKSRSPSFKALHAGIAKLIASQPQPQPRPRKFRHVSRTSRTRRYR